MSRNHLLLPLAIIFFSACLGEPDRDKYGPPEIEAVSATRGPDYSQVVISCRVSKTEGIGEYGFFFDNERIYAEGISGNVFSVTVSGLEYSSTHRYKAWIDGGRGEITSEEKMWSVEDEIPPSPEILTLFPLLGDELGKVSLICRIPDWSSVVRKEAARAGVSFSADSADPSPESSSTEYAAIRENGEYEFVLENLTPSLTYWFKPFVVIGDSITYGEVRNVKIPSDNVVAVTGECTDITSTGAVLHGACTLEDDFGLVCLYGFEIDGKARLAGNVSTDRQFSLSLNDLSPETTYTYRSLCAVGETTFYGESKSFTTLALPPVEDKDYVDLGLNVLWSKCDLGADSPEVPGTNFAWGETAGKDAYSYNWAGYKWCLGTPESITKYSMSRDCAQADNKTVLEPQDDAASVILRGKWRTPTVEDWYDVINYCTGEYGFLNGASGVYLTSTVPGYEGNSIFLPSLAYWTARLSYSRSSGANVAIWLFTWERFAVYDEPDPQIEPPSSAELFDRCIGYPIRPVRER